MALCPVAQEMYATMRMPREEAMEQANAAHQGAGEMAELQTEDMLDGGVEEEQAEGEEEAGGWQTAGCRPRAEETRR